MKKTTTPKPKCPRCQGTRLRIIENPKHALFVFCQTVGCFTYPVNTSAAKPNIMPEALHKLHGELSMAQAEELRKIRLDPGQGIVSAIKRLREMTGTGLKDAHEYVRDYLMEA